MNLFLRVSILTCFIGFSHQLFAQPANDSCGAAIALIPQPFGTTCATGTAGTTNGATPSPFAPSCLGVQADDDVWYMFTATSQSVVIRINNATLIPSGTATVSYALYEGACPTTSTSFICEAATFFGSGFRIVNGLTIGTVYYLRLWNTSTTADMNFSICVQAVPAPPVNDECSGAIGLTVNPYGTSCTSPVAVNTTGATPSTPATSCGSLDNNDDIWYQFTATSQSVLIRIAGATNSLSGSTASGSFALYDGACPATTTAFACDNAFAFGSGYRIVDGLTVGNTYYLRVWMAGSNNYGTMNLCVQEVPAPPSNNECTGAIGLTVNPFGNACTSTVAVNTTGATPSTPATPCGGQEYNDDVWYQFTATSASVMIRASNALLTTSSGNASLGFALYEAACPSATAAFACDGNFMFGNGYQIVDGLTPGNVYYLRIWASGINNYASFNLCVQQVPAAPANDECVNAVGLTMNPYGATCAGTAAVVTTGATQSAFNPVACTNTDNNDDVWYHFTATSASAIIRVSNVQNSITGGDASVGFALYASACPSSTATLACDGNIAFSAGYKIVDGLIPGNTYYLRMWILGVNNYGTFNLCVQEVQAPAPNNECSSAIPITVNSFGTSCNSTVIVNTEGATLSVPNPATCTNVDHNDDLWYSFVAPSLSIMVRMNDAVNTLTASGASVGFSLHAGACPATTASFACSANFGFSNGYQIVDGLTPGQTYYLRVWIQGANNYGRFNLCVQEVPLPPVNNDCAGAINVTPSPPTASCISPVIANTTGATQSTPSPSCAGNETNDDIWYVFTASTTAHRMVVTEAVTTTSNNIAAIGYALYGACPASIATLQCSANALAGNGIISLNGLTIGNTYYLRFWSVGINNYCKFKFCIQQTPQNNECTGAVNLPVGNGFCTTPVSGTLVTATISAGFGVPACNVTAMANDVWYKATVPATGNVIVQTSAVNTTVSNLVMEAYSGACGSLTLISCDDNGNPETTPSANHARIGLMGRTPGEVIYLRVMPLSASNQGDFVICAWDTSASIRPAIASGGNCVGAPIIDISATSANHYMWVPLFDSSGRIIAEVYADGSSLNTITPSLFVNSGPVRNEAGKYFLDRNFSIRASGTGGALIRWYITNSEVAALQAADPTVSGAGNLRILKATDSCHGAYPLPGFSQLIPTANAYGANYYLQTTVAGFSSFYAEGKCGSTIAWTGNVNTVWNDFRNWDCEGVPGPNSIAVIPGGMPRYPTVTTNAEIKRLNLSPGATVTVQAGVQLKLNGQ
jgi:large repetitive protein